MGECICHTATGKIAMERCCAELSSEASHCRLWELKCAELGLLTVTPPHREEGRIMRPSLEDPVAPCPPPCFMQCCPNNIWHQGGTSVCRLANPRGRRLSPVVVDKPPSLLAGEFPVWSTFCLERHQRAVRKLNTFIGSPEWSWMELDLALLLGVRVDTFIPAPIFHTQEGILTTRS